MDDVLVDDTKAQEIALTGETTELTLKVYAEDHETVKEYKVSIQKKDEEVKADKTALKEAIDKAASVDIKKYTEDSVEAMQEALAKAKTVYEDEKADQETVDAAEKALNAAVKGLKEKGKLPYVDVAEGDWFYDGVYFNYFAETMTGKDDTHFAPLENLVRAQFAVIIHRMNGEPAVEYKDTFPDVAENIWYTDAILWAADTEVVTGYTDTGLFGPADDINREQMVVMMYRYANYMKYDTSKKADLSKFEDAANVNEFAKEAMRWAVGTGIITGKYNGTQIDPQGNALRAECAIVIQRFMEIYK